MAKKKSVEYSVTVTIADKVYTGTGATPLEAVTNVPTPPKIMSKGIVAMANGDKVIKVACTPVRLKRFFYSSPLFRQIQAKQLAMGLKHAA